MNKNYIKNLVSQYPPSLIVTLGVTTVGAIIGMVGLGFISKVVFTNGTTKQGKRCYSISGTNFGILRFTLILLWALVPFQIYDLYKLSCSEKSLKCNEIIPKYGLLTILILEIISLIALSRFAFNLKRDIEGNYCGSLGEVDHNLAKISIFAIWGSVIWYGLHGGKSLFEYFKKQRKTTSACISRMRRKKYS